MNVLREPLLLLLASLAVGWGVYVASGPPQPLPADVPADVFSAERAGVILERLYAGLGPHVSGSPANAELRERILGALEAAGYRPDVQRRYHCNPMFGACSPVENIVAVLEGSGEDRAAILLTAHYDSTWTGPGVADDGAGVAAVIEIARMSAQSGKFRNDLIFLLSDAEELGLIGAHAFTALHPLFDRVRAVINLEARGVTGPSAMFETAQGNRGMIRLLAKNLARPVANSLTYEMYRRMPNYTDFSIYRDQPVAGVNFAFVDGVAAYHSRIDDLERLDRASLQHHGQNAWSVLTALDGRTLNRMVSAEDAVYVDLFSRGVLHYPESTAAGLALVISVLVVIAIQRSHARQIALRQLFWCGLAIAALAIALPAAGWLLSWPLGRWPDQHPLDHPWPWAGRLVLFLAAILVFQRVLAWLVPRASTGSVMLACWGAYAALALVTATLLPAASFVPLLPLLAFMIGLALDGLRWRKEPRLVFAGLGGFLAALYVGLYLAKMIETVAAFDAAALRMLPLVLPAVAALPLLLGSADRRGRALRGSVPIGVLVVAGTVGHAWLPAYTPERPRDLAVHYRQLAGTADAWLVLESRFGSIDRDYAERHGFRPVDLPAWGAPASERLAVPTEPLDLPVVSARARRVGAGQDAPSSERVLLDLALPEGLRQLSIALPEGASLLNAALDRAPMFDSARPARRDGGPLRLVLHEPPAGAARIEMELMGGAAPGAELHLDARFDLPAARLAPFEADWPPDAQPAFLGPRAVVRYRVPVADAPAGR